VIRLILFFLFISYTAIDAQSSGVRFARIDLTAAKQRAEIEDKLIFIDTYATYCQACKKLEREFRDSELSKFFNKHFINVKIDMDTKAGNEIKNAYQVVFLPTILVLDQFGNQILKMDRLATADELLSLAKYLQNKSYPGSFAYAAAQTNAGKRPAAPAKKVVKNKKESQKSPVARVETIPVAKNEKIVHVFGQDDPNLPPEILKEEAYFRMQLMDGSHQEAAKKYLASQTDWSTEENMRFLFDFLYSVNTKEFEYLVSNKPRFENLLGAAAVSNTLNILVDKELTRAFPRPGLDKAEKLYTLLDPTPSKHLAAEYHLQNLYSEGKFDQFISFGRQHMLDGCNNHKILFDLSNFLFQRATSEEELRESLSASTKALDLKPSNVEYLYLNERIQKKLDSKK